MSKRLRAMRVHQPEPKVPAEPDVTIIKGGAMGSSLDFLDRVVAPKPKPKPKKGGLLRRKR